MKINWGTGIVIAFGLFMSFILFFVFKVQSNSKYDNELVVEKYYQKEQGFEKEMEKEQNAHDLPIVEDTAMTTCLGTGHRSLTGL